jgi:hypothetical protein
MSAADTWYSRTSEKCSRRNFLSGAALAGAATLVGESGSAFASTADSGRPFKVCVFADLHYFPGVMTNSEDTSFLESIMARAEREKCDMMLQLGDFVHEVKSARTRQLVKMYNDFKIPGFHCLGNHDQDGNPYELTCEAYRMPREGYYYVDRGGFRFVVTDPNYIRMPDGKFVHFSSGNYFKRPKGSSINWLPPEQMEWLRSTIVGSPYPCIVSAHQSYERMLRTGAVGNSEDVRALFNEANAKKPGTVRAVLNGHHHVDNLRLIDNILYWDVNSANDIWFAAVHKCYPAEFLKKCRHAGHILAWDKPLSAVLSLWPDGRIKIEGMRGDWLFGVSPEKAGLRQYDGDARRYTCEIKSVDLTLNFG